MEKKDLINILDTVFIPNGFKRKGNYWVFNSTEINKIINLQKSQFGNSYYINYGYVLNAIPLDNLSMHIFKGLGSSDESENSRIKELLNLDKEISKEAREKELQAILNHQIIEDFNNVNSEEEFVVYLKTLKPPYSNTIPVIIKKYFDLVSYFN